MMANPREKRQARTRQEILDAALALINEKGPDNFSLRALARRVDYSPAGLYEYFDSKDDIVSAVCEGGDRELRGYLERVPADLPSDQYFVQLGEAYIQFALQNKEHFMLMFSQGPAAAYEEVAVDETYGILLNAVQKAIDQGFFLARSDLNVHDTAYGLWSLAHGLAIMQLTNLAHVAYDFERADRAVLQTFIRGLKTP
jgi:AcrR family transcriptional regulator